MLCDWENSETKNSLIFSVNVHRILEDTILCIDDVLPETFIPCPMCMDNDKFTEMSFAVVVLANVIYVHKVPNKNYSKNPVGTAIVSYLGGKIKTPLKPSSYNRAEHYPAHIMSQFNRLYNEYYDWADKVIEDFMR